MKKTFYIFLFFIACNTRNSRPEGAYSAFDIQEAASGKPGDSVHVIKIFKDGFWIAVRFGNNFQSMDNCSGGTYEMRHNKYAETCEFSSIDSSRVGTTKEVSYRMVENSYYENEYNNSSIHSAGIPEREFREMISSEPLMNDKVEGAWKTESGQVGYSRNGDDYIKIYSYPRFAWAHYNKKLKKFIAAGGGHYQFNGETITETFDYSTYGIAIRTAIQLKYKKISKDKMMLRVIDSFYDEEIWTRGK